MPTQETPNNQPAQAWKPADYERNGRFVANLALVVVDLLAPQPAERILDLGCGDGALTEKIVASGATVVGVDSSPAMIAAAKQRGLDVHLMNAIDLPFQGEFDAVFSNAALHWIGHPDATISGIRRALKPGGRFVAEFGAHGNVAAIHGALLAVLRRYNRDVLSALPWYFPTVDEYRFRLETGGFSVDYIESIQRPTPLPTDMAAWIETFANGLLARVAPEHRAEAVTETVAVLRPLLCDDHGRWTADYVRLRLRAHLP